VFLPAHGEGLATEAGGSGALVVKPFRFGVNALSAGSRAEWAAKARKLEDMGYWILSVPDHLTEMLAPMPALVAAAEAPTRLRVGTNVLTTISATRCSWRARRRPSTF